MINCPFISSYANRLLQRQRPKSVVRSDPRSHIKGANRQRTRPIPRQPRLPNGKTATFNPQNNASAAASKPAHSALSP